MNWIPGMRVTRRALLIVALLFICVGCDQVTKSMARQNLAESGAISFPGDVFRLQYAENSGAFLSLGAGMPESFRYWLFTVSTGFLVTGALIFLIKSRKITQLQSVALCFMLGGGVGNLIDRVCNEGRVIDFMNLGIGSLRTGVFNVADIAILVGCILFFALQIREGKA